MVGALPRTSRLILKALTAVLIVKVTIAVVSGYGNYFPPDFGKGFLHGREAYFDGHYRWAFYTHIISGPLSLLVGLVLISETLRNRFPAWHRYLGRAQGLGVLFLVAPSGLVMARYAAAGPVGGAGLAVLALLTAVCVSLGWRAALHRRYVTHRRWMTRTMLLLSSAVVIRLMGGFATVAGITADWFDPLASWACWVLPLAAYELGTRWPRRLTMIQAARESRETTRTKVANE